MINLLLIKYLVIQVPIVYIHLLVKHIETRLVSIVVEIKLMVCFLRYCSCHRTISTGTENGHEVHCLSDLHQRNNKSYICRFWTARVRKDPFKCPQLHIRLIIRSGSDVEWLDIKKGKGQEVRKLVSRMCRGLAGILPALGLHNLHHKFIVNANFTQCTTKNHTFGIVFTLTIHVQKHHIAISQWEVCCRWLSLYCLAR